MPRFLIFVGLFGMVGCGRPPQPAAKDEPPVNHATVERLKAPRMVQIPVTDEHGATRILTVPEVDHPGIPVVPMAPQKTPEGGYGGVPASPPPFPPGSVIPLAPKKEGPSLPGTPPKITEPGGYN